MCEPETQKMGLICMLFRKPRHPKMNWIILVSSFSNTIPDISVHVGEDMCISLVSYRLTRTYKLDKWIKH